MHRDSNKQADALATEGVLAFGRVERGRWRKSDRAKFLRVWFDGGCREGKMGAGVRLEAGSSLGLDGRPNWELVVGFGVKLVGGLGKRADSGIAEAVGCGLSVCILWELLSGCEIVFTPHCNVCWTCEHAKKVWQAIEDLLCQC